MRIFLFIILAIETFTSLAQFDYIDQSELYKKHGVTEVQSFFHDSTLIERAEAWRIDSEGRMIHQEYLPRDDDSSYSEITWTYANDQLSRRMEIGVWNISSNKLDTALTEYFYTSEGNVSEERSCNTKDQDTLLHVYLYRDEHLVIGRLYNPHQPWWYWTDSIEPYSSGFPKLKSTTSYYDGAPEYRKEQYLDTLRRIQVEIEYEFTGACSKPVRTRTFTYDGGQLKSIKTVFLGNGLPKTVFSSEITYGYNDQGLVTNQSRRRDGAVWNYDTYRYR